MLRDLEQRKGSQKHASKQRQEDITTEGCKQVGVLQRPLVKHVCKLLIGKLSVAGKHNPHQTSRHMHKMQGKHDVGKST